MTYRWLIILIFTAFLSACSPPQTYPLLDSTLHSPDESQPNLEAQRSNAQPLWISQLKMFDWQNGWSLDDLGRVLRTTEGIEIWEDVSPAQPDPKTYITTSFLDIQRAVVIYYTPDNEKFESWITDDGGENWQKGSPLPADSPGSLTPVDLFFLTPHHGWFAATFNPGLERIETVLFETSDGGSTWELIHVSLRQNGSEQVGALPGSFSLPFGNLMVFTSPVHGYASNGSLYETWDGGRTWEMVFLDPPDENLVAENPYIHISTPSFTSDKGVFMMTVFGADPLPAIPGDISRVSPIANYLFYTTDGGNTWSGIDAPALIGRVQFLSPQVGWFLGKDDSSPLAQARLFKTMDGGDTWHVVQEALPLPLGTQLVMLDEVGGYAFNLFASQQLNLYEPFDERAGTTPYLFQTRDGGITWIEIEPFLALKNGKKQKNN
jgi:photosystem II stability/assembly factor-like uncharacterized protein